MMLVVSLHPHYGALPDVRPPKMVQRPIRRPITPTPLSPLLASIRWSSPATSSMSAGSFGVVVGLRSPRTCRTYYTVISIGGVSFRVAMDTASSDIWVVSSACSTAQCKSLPKYPLTTYNSPTFVSVNQNATLFNVSFADTTSAYQCITLQFPHLAPSCVWLCRRGSHQPWKYNRTSTGVRYVVPFPVVSFL